MGKTYTLSQVLFGLRNEYLEVERQLAKLKRNILLGDNIESADFHIVGNPCKLDLYLHKRKTLLDKIEMILGVYVHGRNVFDVTSGVSRDYYLGNKKACSVVGLEKTNEQIKNIVEGEFFNNIVANNYVSIPFKTDDIVFSLVARDKSLLVAPYGIDVIDGVSADNECFAYNAHRDEIEVKSNPDDVYVTTHNVLDVLNLEINSDYLNDYHRSVIDKQEEKEVVVGAFCYRDNVKLQIREEAKKYILKPKSVATK